jgi:hypothetical protein
MTEKTIQIGRDDGEDSVAKPAPSLAKYLLPGMGDMLFILLFVSVIGLGPRLFNIDGDLGRHLTIGEYILQSRSIPTQDIFSHTMAGEHLTPHEWLAQIAYSLAHRAMGLDGVVFLSAAIIAVTFWICYRQCRRGRGMVLLAFLFAFMAAAAASLHWLARPHLFTMLFVVLWTGQLERMRQGDARRWWILPAIMLAWANTHGAFIAGFVIWGAYVVGGWLEEWKDGRVEDWKGGRLEDGSKAGYLRILLLGGGTSLLVTFINPAGWRLWETSLGFLRSRYLVSHTLEYQSPNFHQSSTWPFLFLLFLSILILGFAIVYSPHPGDPQSKERILAGDSSIPISHILLLAGWTSMALYSARNIPLYAVVIAPILAGLASQLILSQVWLRALADLDQRLYKVDGSLRGHLSPVIFMFIIAALLRLGIPLDFESKGNQYDPDKFPVQAVDWLEANPPPGEMYNYFIWGGYLLYRAWPEHKVFIDGQTDFYGESFTREYDQVLNLRDGWHEVLERYGVDWVIIPTESALVAALLSEPDWRLVYNDETAAILLNAWLEECLSREDFW